MKEYVDSPYETSLELVADLSNRGIQLLIAEREVQREMDEALKVALRDGVGIDDLSNASGIPPSQIRRRVGLVMDHDLSALTGTNKYS